MEWKTCHFLVLGVHLTLQARRTAAAWMGARMPCARAPSLKLDLHGAGLSAMVSGLLLLCLYVPFKFVLGEMLAARGGRWRWGTCLLPALTRASCVGRCCTMWTQATQNPNPTK